MCGIAGYISKEPNLVSEKQVKETLNLMKRRGPDNLSSKKISYTDCEINLLHSRLNIIDLIVGDSTHKHIFFNKFVIPWEEVLEPHPGRGYTCDST